MRRGEGPEMKVKMMYSGTSWFINSHQLSKHLTYGSRGDSWPLLGPSLSTPLDISNWNKMVSPPEKKKNTHTNKKQNNNNNNDDDNNNCLYKPFWSCGYHVLPTCSAPQLGQMVLVVVMTGTYGERPGKHQCRVGLPGQARCCTANASPHVCPCTLDR